MEGIYHQCLIEELKHRKINFLTEMGVPITYRRKQLNVDFRCDLFVAQCIVVELKSVQEIILTFEAQLLTCMKLLQSTKGLLINFNCLNIFREGQRTFVNEYFSLLPDH
ncbi:GxxExxY protein [Elizabethkingia anophelis]|uniref:GxxExxY protein n=1 Tax=Elizabethkingia anophelis TaxID=1117645 RepID=UPI00200EB5AC|nr:GxxExxY protein [Elizabethkingia anophelis]MCL1032939.1 GxxExxY protein [Elizabethkingia anophelis]